MLLPRRGGILERVSREEWNLGVIRQSVADIVLRGMVQPVRWLPPMTRWHGLADPACHMLPDGTRLLLAERINYWNGRGEIWAAHVKPGDDPVVARFHPWATSRVHLSYPFPFMIDDQLNLIVETAEARILYLCRYQHGTWNKTPILERPAIDATIWYDQHHNRWWLFCTFADDAPDQNLHAFYSEQVGGEWSAHPLNPIKSDLASSRPAGPLFWADGRLIRPSQDCTRSYGSAIVLNAVTELTTRTFQEHPVRRLSPNAEYPDGLHTLCPAGDETIIDGKRWNFHPLDPVRYAIAGGLKRYRRLRRGPLTLNLGRV